MGIVVRISFDIGYVHGLPVNECPAHDEVPARWSWEDGVVRFRLLRRHLVDGNELEQPTLKHRNRTEGGVAEAGSVGDNRVERRLQIAWGAADNAQNLSGRSLLLTGLA